MILNLPEKELWARGHRSCAGCGSSLAMRYALKAAGPNTIVVQATGCMEVVSTPYPETAWEVPYIHAAFENAAAVASGVWRAMKKLNRTDINVLAIGGDGGTFDIGLQALSGAFERGENITYLCNDNEAYMNCLSICSLIMTKDGLKNILDIKVGEKIAAFEQKTQSLVYKKCTGVFNNGVKNVYELTTDNHSIKATGNHPFLVLKRNGRGKQNGFLWKTLEEIKKGDEVVTLKNIKEEKQHMFLFKETKKGDYKVNKINSVKIPKKSSPALMKYLGIFIGDGWVREKKAETGFALPDSSRERKEFIKLHKRIFNCRLGQDKMYVYAYSVNLAKFILSLGFEKGAKNKTIPSWVFTLPLKERMAFIEGLMLSDGYKNGNSWRYVSSSSALLKRLRLLAQITGFRVGKIHWQHIKKGKKCVKRMLLKDTSYGYICMSKKTKPNLVMWPSQTKYRNFLAGNKYFDVNKVIGIRLIGKEPTLDLRVEGEHNFIADGIVVHNTGIQRSGATPKYADTTTSPAGSKVHGKTEYAKNMPFIMAAHGAYVATTNIAFPQDFVKTMKKALEIKGPAYVQALCPCQPGWKHDPSETISIAKLAFQTRVNQMFEIENGILTITKKPATTKHVAEYLKTQGRFKHIRPDELSEIQKSVDASWERLLKLEESKLKIF